MKRRLREDPFGWRSASQLGQLQLAWSSPEWVGLATSLWQSAGRYPDAHGIFRQHSAVFGSRGSGAAAPNCRGVWFVRRFVRTQRGHSRIADHYRRSRITAGDSMLVKGDLDQPIEGAPDKHVLARHGADAHQQHHAGIFKAVDPLVVEWLEYERRHLLVFLQLVADPAQYLDHAIDVLAVRNRDAGDRVSEFLGQILDRGHLAERHGVDDPRLVAQPDRADRDRLDRSPVVLADIDDVADRDLVLDQNEEPRDDVLDERLAAEADRQTDNPGAGQKRCDVEADL